MTYHPVLSDQECETVIAALDLTAKQIGVRIAQEGPTDSFIGQLGALQQLKAKILGAQTRLSEVESASPEAI